MSITDLSTARKRREDRDERLARARQGWDRSRRGSATGRKAGIAWAKDRATPQQLFNLASYRIGLSDDVNRQGCINAVGAHMLLLHLTHPFLAENFKYRDEEELVPVDLNRPIAEVVGALVQIVGEQDARCMFADARFRTGWIAGAVDYWDATRSLE